MKKFNKEIRIWLLALGFSEIYKINHPTETKNEVHFIKNGIRVCCVKNCSDEYYYLSACVYLKESLEVLSLRTGKYKLFDELVLNKLINIVSKQKSKLEKTSLKYKIVKLFDKIKNKLK